MKKIIVGSKYKKFGRIEEPIKRQDFCESYKKAYIDMLTHTKFLENKDAAITLLLDTMMDMILRMDNMAKIVRKLENINKHSGTK